MLGGLDYRSLLTTVYRIATALGYARSGANTDITSLASVTVGNLALKTQTLTDGASVDWNMDLGGRANWTMAGDRALNNPTNGMSGGIYILKITQDATGGRKVTWGIAYRGLNAAVNMPQPNPAPASTTVYVFFGNTAAGFWLISNPAPFFGQCRLTKSAANLLLSPFGGNQITIGGRPTVIPDAGVTLAPTALAATTLYYIYAFVTGSTVTLEAVVTAPAVQAGTGLMIKTGDDSRTLVGMARTDAGVAWADSATQRFVRSWFNEPGIAGLNTFSADRSTASGTYVELNSEIRCEFLAWTGEQIRYSAVGSAANGASGYSSSAVGFDGTAAEAGSETLTLSPSAGQRGSIAIAGGKTGLAEGYHYATLLGKVDVNTGTWHSATAATTAKVYLHVSSGGR